VSARIAIPLPPLDMVSAGENEGMEAFAPCVVNGEERGFFFDKESGRNFAFDSRAGAEAWIERASAENPQLLDMDLRVVTVRLARPS
jgi:hypothetical protein